MILVIFSQGSSINRDAAGQLGALRLALERIELDTFGQYGLAEQCLLCNASWIAFTLDIYGKDSQTFANKSLHPLMRRSFGESDDHAMTRFRRELVVAVVSAKADAFAGRGGVIPEELRDKLAEAEKAAKHHEKANVVQQLIEMQDDYWKMVACKLCRVDLLENVQRRDIGAMACVQSELTLAASLTIGLADNVERLRTKLFTAHEVLGSSDDSVFLSYQLLRQWYRFTHQSLLDRALSDGLTKSLFRADRVTLLEFCIGRAEWLVDQAVLFADHALFLKGMTMLKDVNADLFTFLHLPSKDLYTTVFDFRWLRVTGKANIDFDINNMVKTCAVSSALQKCLHAHPFVHLRFGVAFHLRLLGNDLDTMWRASKYKRKDVSDLIEFIDWLDSHTKVTDSLFWSSFFFVKFVTHVPTDRLLQGAFAVAKKSKEDMAASKSVAP
jgi:hypothetical protein